MIREDGARGTGFEVVVDSLVQVAQVQAAELNVPLFTLAGGIEVRCGGFDTASGGTRLLPLIGREGRLGRVLRIRLRIHGFARARAELGGALALGLEARFVGLAAAPVSGGAFAGGLLLLGFFRWQGGSFFLTRVVGPMVSLRPVYYRSPEMCSEQTDLP